MTVRSLFVLTIMVSPVIADRDAALHAYQRRDFITAFREWQVVAENGDPEAEFRLGVMYEHGEGMPAQAGEAAKWYRKAADQGYSQAQCALGKLYADGRGVLQDYIEAHKWLNLSSANGEAEAAKLRDKVADKMIPAQVADAQRLAREWRPTPAQKRFTPPVGAVKNPNPKLVMDPTIIAPPDTPLPNVNLPNWGDPLAKMRPPSNGAGSGGGVGSGKGGRSGPGGANSCEPYRAKYDQLNIGDHWTKISQFFGRPATMEDTAGGDTVYVYEFRVASTPQRLADCTLTFRAGSNNTLVAKEANPPISAAPERAAPVTAKDSALNVENGVSAPVVLYKIDPQYSEEARKAELEGTVLLTLVVDALGHARNIGVVRSLGLGLDERAVEAVNAWKFRPGSKDGQVVAVIATIEVNFHLQGSSYPGWRLGRAVFQIPDGASRPILTEFAQPKTHAYKGAGQNSTVLQFEVDSDGIPRQLKFTVDPEREVKNDLLAAVKKWRFTPAEKDGMPVSANATFEFVWEEAKQ
jgi:TonB family protein